MKKDETVDIVTFDLDKIKGHCKTLTNMMHYDGVDGTINQTWDIHLNKLGLSCEDGLSEEILTPLFGLASMIATFDFYKKYQIYPLDNDINEMIQLTTEVLKRKNLNVELNNQYVEEICRFGGVQIHSTCSIIGSFVAQTLIHYTTDKFAGLNDTFFFDTTTGLSVHGKL